jgi:hypothetical protein
VDGSLGQQPIRRKETGMTDHRLRTLRRHAGLVVLVVAALGIAALMALYAVTSQSSAASSPQTANPGFDVTVPPPDVRPVVVVSGTPYEMGYQYGQQARDLIARNAVKIKADTLPIWGTWDAMVSRMDQYEAAIAAKAPEVPQIWHGIADGAGVSYDDVRLINLSLELVIMPPSQAASSQCSHISAWGAATRNHEVIAGQNTDQTYNAGNYTVVLVAFPASGNAFITTPPHAGELAGGFGMNSKGLVSLGSGGQGARPEDTAIGCNNMCTRMHILLTCDNATQAKDMYVDMNPDSAENAQFVDASGTANVVEHTPAVQVVRKAGDYGENDFLVATNGFLAKEMQPAMYPGKWNGGWYDWLPRQVTYTKLIRDNFGAITVSKVMAFMASHDYWDGKAWHRNVWSLWPAIDDENCWTPEMHDSAYKTLMRSVAVPKDLTTYLMQGETDVRSSVIPNATGTFCKLVLGQDPATMAATAEADCEMQLYYAARNLDLAANPSPARDAKLTKAKLAMWQGINLQAEAGATTDDANLAALLYGQALTCFCKAQCYAQQASGHSIAQ